VGIPADIYEEKEMGGILMSFCIEIWPLRRPLLRGWLSKYLVSVEK